MSLAVFSSVSAEFSLERSRECIPKEGLLSSPVLSEVLPSLEPLRSSTVRKLARRGIPRGWARDSAETTAAGRGKTPTNFRKRGYEIQFFAR